MAESSRSGQYRGRPPGGSKYRGRGMGRVTEGLPPPAGAEEGIPREAQQGARAAVPARPRYRLGVLARRPQGKGDRVGRPAPPRQTAYLPGGCRRRRSGGGSALSSTTAPPTSAGPGGSTGSTAKRAGTSWATTSSSATGRTRPTGKSKSAPAGRSRSTAPIATRPTSTTTSTASASASSEISTARPHGPSAAESGTARPLPVPPVRHPRRARLHPRPSHGEDPVPR